MSSASKSLNLCVRDDVSSVTIHRCTTLRSDGGFANVSHDRGSGIADDFYIRQLHVGERPKKASTPIRLATDS